MRLFCLALAGALILCGCAKDRRLTSPGRNHPPAPRSRLIVTPGAGLNGRVVSVNPARYVVLRFPLGELPSIDARLDVFRNGLRVAELKVTGLI